MLSLVYLSVLLILSSCNASQASPPIAGVYEFKEGGGFLSRNEYDVFTLSEKEIAHRSARSGLGHQSWKGCYLRQDSLIDVLVYFSFYQDANVGFTAANTQQRRIRLTVREDGGKVFLIRKNAPFPGDTFPNISLSLLVSGVYAKTSDSIKFYPPPVTDCQHYGNNRIQFSSLQKYGPDSTQIAEQMLYDLLTDHLNTVLDTVPTNPNFRKIATATALLKLNTSPDFSLPEVTIFDNSTRYSTEQLMTSFESFGAKKLRAFNDPHLQDYLLVVMAVSEEGICVLPPYRKGLFSLGR